jgi:hypothetical protein
VARPQHGRIVLWPSSLERVRAAGGHRGAKKIKFPDPAADRNVQQIDSFPTVVLVRLLEMKLACGLSNPRRPQDIADALRLMEAHKLDKRFAGRLHPLLRKDYRRLVDVIRTYPRSQGPT